MLRAGALAPGGPGSPGAPGSAEISSGPAAPRTALPTPSYGCAPHLRSPGGTYTLRGLSPTDALLPRSQHRPAAPASAPTHAQRSLAHTPGREGHPILLRKQPSVFEPGVPAPSVSRSQGSACGSRIRGHRVPGAREPDREAAPRSTSRSPSISSAPGASTTRCSCRGLRPRAQPPAAQTLPRGVHAPAPSQRSPTGADGPPDPAQPPRPRVLLGPLPGPARAPRKWEGGPRESGQGPSPARAQPPRSLHPGAAPVRAPSGPRGAYLSRQVSASGSAPSPAPFHPPARRSPGVQVSVSRERCTGRRWGHTSCLREAPPPPPLTWAQAPPWALGWHRGPAGALSLRTASAVLRPVR